MRRTAIGFRVANAAIPRTTVLGVEEMGVYLGIHPHLEHALGVLTEANTNTHTFDIVRNGMEYALRLRAEDAGAAITGAAIIRLGADGFTQPLTNIPEEWGILNGFHEFRDAIRAHRPTVQTTIGHNHHTSHNYVAIIMPTAEIPEECVAGVCALWLNH